jgi:hypothetical protein
MQSTSIEDAASRRDERIFDDEDEDESSGEGETAEYQRWTRLEMQASSEDSDSDSSDIPEPALAKGKPVTGTDIFPKRFDLFDPKIMPILGRADGLKMKANQVPLYEATYLEAKKRQAAHPGRPSAYLDLPGDEFFWPECSEPYGGNPYPITVSTVSANVEVKLAMGERSYPTKSDKTANGLEAKLEIDEWKQGCFADRGKGLIKIQKAWQGAGKQALYECFVEMNVKYSSEPRHGGHGTGAEYNSAMWALAGEEENDDGEEELQGIDGEEGQGRAAVGTSGPSKD